MASKKRKGAKIGAKVGARVAPKAGKAAWKLGKGEAKLVRRAMSSREPKAARFVKYGFFALAGLAVGTLIGRSGRNGSDGNWYTRATVVISSGRPAATSSCHRCMTSGASSNGTNSAPDARKAHAKASPNVCRSSGPTWISGCMPGGG